MLFPRIHTETTIQRNHREITETKTILLPITLQKIIQIKRIELKTILLQIILQKRIRIKRIELKTILLQIILQKRIRIKRIKTKTIIKNEIIRKIIQMPVRKMRSIIMQSIQNRLQKRIHITIILTKTQTLQPEEIIRNTTTRILITPIKAM